MKTVVNYYNDQALQTIQQEALKKVIEEEEKKPYYQAAKADMYIAKNLDIIAKVASTKADNAIAKAQLYNSEQKSAKNTAESDYFIKEAENAKSEAYKANIDAKIAFSKAEASENALNATIKKLVEAKTEAIKSIYNTPVNKILPIKIPIKVFEDLSILFAHFSLFFIYSYLKKIFIKLHRFFLFVDSKKHYNVLLERLLEISKK